MSFIPNTVSIDNFWHEDGRRIAIIYRYPMTPFMELVAVTDVNGEELLTEDYPTFEELRDEGWVFPMTPEEFGAFFGDHDGWLESNGGVPQGGNNTDTPEDTITEPVDENTPPIPDVEEEVVDIESPPQEEEPISEEITEPEETPEGDEVLATFTRFSAEDNGIHTLVLDYRNPDTPVVHSLTGVNGEPLTIPNNLNELINVGFIFPLNEEQFLVFVDDPEQWANTYLPEITGEDIQTVEDDDVEGSDPAIIPGEGQPDTEIPEVEEEDDESVSEQNDGFALDVSFAGIQTDDFTVSASQDISEETSSTASTASTVGNKPIVAFRYENIAGFPDGRLINYLDETISANWSVVTPDGNYISSDFRPGNLQVGARETTNDGTHLVNFSFPDEIGLMNASNNEFSMNWSVEPLGYSINGGEPILFNSRPDDFEGIEVTDGESIDVELFASISSGTTIDSMDDDTGVPGDFRTSDTDPTFFGTASPGSTVRLTTDGAFYGETQADGNGNWVFAHQNPTELPDGQFLLTAEDLNTGALGYQNIIIDTDFDITFRLLGDIDPSLQGLIEEAEEFWEGVITADVPDIGEIDDIEIDVYVANLGNPNQLAEGTPTFFREDAEKLPYRGALGINETTTNEHAADAIKHEIGHALGISKRHYLENRRDLLVGVGNLSLTGDPGFTGSNAVREYIKVSGVETYAVPLEGDFSSFSHWDEDALGDELMTTTTNNRDGILSTVTIGALNDLGYEVDYNRAETYEALKPIIEIPAGGLFSTPTGKEFIPEIRVIDELATAESGVSVFKISFDEDLDGILEVIEVNDIDSNVYDNIGSFSISGSPGRRSLEVIAIDNFGITEIVSIPVNVYAVPDF